MDDKTLIAKRVARALPDGALVNLGIGLPTLVARYLPAGLRVMFQSENGVLGMAAVPAPGLENADLTDAGGGSISAAPGACAFDSAMSFGLIRGGHLDVTVLGGMEVNQRGQLANWMAPGGMVAGMGGAMDLATGARRVIVAMTHTAKGKPKIKRECAYPLTAIRRVDLVVTEMAVIEPTDAGLALREIAPGISVGDVIAATEAPLIVPQNVAVMEID